MVYRFFDWPSSYTYIRLIEVGCEKLKEFFLDPFSELFKIYLVVGNEVYTIRCAVSCSYLALLAPPVPTRDSHGSRRVLGGPAVFVFFFQKGCSDVK